MPELPCLAASGGLVEKRERREEKREQKVSKKRRKRERKERREKVVFLRLTDDRLAVGLHPGADEDSPRGDDEVGDDSRGLVESGGGVWRGKEREEREVEVEVERE